MPDRRLRELLDDLHEQIDAVGATDAAARERLAALVADLEHRLAAPEDRDHHENLVRNLREAIAQFEVDNPRTTGLLNHIMVTLSNMGI